MYTAQFTVERIQNLIKSKGLTQKTVFANCDIGEDTVKRMTDKKGISSFSLAKIADELDCSVDYLLGRTDTPNISIHSSNIVNGNNGHNSPLTVESPVTDNILTEFLNVFNNLSFENKLKAMSFVVEMKNGN